MPVIKIPRFSAQALISARALPPDEASALRKEVFGALRAHFRIPHDTKLKVEIDTPTASDYLVLKDKHSDMHLHAGRDGVFSHAEAPLPAAPAPSTPVSTIPTVPAGPAYRAYVRIPVHLLTSLDDGGIIDGGELSEGSEDHFDLIHREDCGRVAFDERLDCVLVAVNA